jgi:hypothetical protein
MPPKRGRAAAAQSSEISHDFGAFTDLRATTNAGGEISFDTFADKVILVVNVARL